LLSTYPAELLLAALSGLELGAFFASTLDQSITFDSEDKRNKLVNG